MGQKASSITKSFSRSNSASTNSISSIQEYSGNYNIGDINYKDDEPLPVQKAVTKKDSPTTTDIEGGISLTMRLKQKVLKSSSFVEQTLPMLVSLTAQNLKSDSKAPLDLVCVIDHSGSMSGEKIKLVKNTFNYLLEYLGDSDRLSIIIFDDRCSRLTPLMRTTSSNKKAILSKIKTIEANGGTDIDHGMRHAFEVLKQRREANAVTSIFLLSDGLDGGAQNKVSNSLKQAGLEDVSINTFGFGKDHDPKLMIDIANLRDGSFYFIEKLDTVDEAFVDCLGGALSSLTQNVTISIKAEQSEILKGVEIVKAYGDATMWNYDSNSKVYTTKLASLISGRQKDFVLELKIPANDKELLDHQKSIKVASAQADMTGLDGRPILKTAELNITLLNEGEVLQDEEPDREVMKNFYRVKGALVVSDAQALADKNQHEEAKKMLQAFKEEISNSFMKNEEFIMNLVKDIDSAINSVNPVVYQVHGKHAMMENARAQMKQKSNFSSANCYQNKMQCDMIQEVRAKKAGFFS